MTRMRDATYYGQAMHHRHGDTWGRLHTFRDITDYLLAGDMTIEQIEFLARQLQRVEREVLRRVEQMEAAPPVPVQFVARSKPLGSLHGLRCTSPADCDCEPLVVPERREAG